MAAIVAQEEQPISRTYQYRKVMKPMLERKRRARINRCLDELKELLVGALQAEGESVSRLEKADVLELTVRHLHKLRRSQQLSDSGSGDKFKAGFIQCANEVSKYMTTLSNTVDLSVSSRLLAHLDGCIRHIDVPAPNTILSPSTCASGPGGLNILTSYTPPASPISSPKNLNHAAAVAAHLNSTQLLNHAKLLGYLPPGAGTEIAMSHYQHHLAGKPMPHLVSSQVASLKSMFHPPGIEGIDEPFDLSRDNVWRPW